MTLSDGQPPGFDLVLPSSYNVSVSLWQGSKQMTIKRPCHRCGHVHGLTFSIYRDAKSFQVIAIAYPRDHWPRCEACGAELQLALWRPAQDAFAKEMLTTMTRLLEYDNLVEGKFVVQTRIAIPSLP